MKILLPSKFLWKFPQKFFFPGWKIELYSNNKEDLDIDQKQGPLKTKFASIQEIFLQDCKFKHRILISSTDIESEMGLKEIEAEMQPNGKPQISGVCVWNAQQNPC